MEISKINFKSYVIDIFMNILNAILHVCVMEGDDLPCDVKITIVW